MQLTTFLFTASAMITTASATRNAVTLMKECDLEKPFARVINRCEYDVYLWSVFKGEGCPTAQMVTLKTGDVYAENYASSNGTDVGISIKLSKSTECQDTDITQLEYYIDESTAYAGNYLDVSYVDCGGMDCPARKDGYYLVAGDQTGKAKAAADNTWCPVLSCTDADSCDKTSYVLPDDKQTKSCLTTASMDFYMCGGDAPTQDYDSTPKQKPSSSSSSSSSTQAGYPTTPSPTPTEETVYAAAITPSPSSPTPSLVKTEVVYVTAFVNGKRHEHGRRHQHFRA